MTQFLNSVCVFSLAVAIAATTLSGAAAGGCGGGCISSSQCAEWGGSTDCRCTWFSCKSIMEGSAAGPIAELFDEFKRNYASRPDMIDAARNPNREVRMGQSCAKSDSFSGLALGMALWPALAQL